MSGSIGSHDGDDLPKRSSETSLEVSRGQNAVTMSLSSDEVNYLVFRYVPTISRLRPVLILRDVM